MLPSIPAPQSQTMTSREIADLVEKRHDNVLRTIETLVDGKVITLPQYEEVSNPGAGPRTVKQCRVGKRDSYIIVAQLSPEFTARLVDRWQELEAGTAYHVPTSMAAALRLAADQADIIEAQAAELAAAAPSIEFVAKYADSTGLKGFREVCKLLKANEARFREFLLSQKIMYRLGGALMPFHNHMDAGRFEVKAGTAGEKGHAYNSARFTPKGVTWVAGEYAKFQLEANTQG